MKITCIFPFSYQRKCNSIVWTWCCGPLWWGPWLGPIRLPMWGHRSIVKGTEIEEGREIWRGASRRSRRSGGTRSGTRSPKARSLRRGLSASRSAAPSARCRSLLPISPKEKITPFFLLHYARLFDRSPDSDRKLACQDCSFSLVSRGVSTFLFFHLTVGCFLAFSCWILFLQFPVLKNSWLIIAVVSCKIPSIQCNSMIFNAIWSFKIST